MGREMGGMFKREGIKKKKKKKGGDIWLIQVEV